MRSIIFLSFPQNKMKENYYVFNYLDVNVQVCNLFLLLENMTERSASMKFYKKYNCNLDDKEYKRHTCMKVRMLLRIYMIQLL